MRRITAPSIWLALMVTIPSYVAAQTSPTDAPTLDSFGNFLKVLATMLRVAAYGLAVATVIYAGILYLTAYGDESKPTQAKNLLKGVAIGLLFIVLSEVIVSALLRGVSSPTNAANQQSAVNTVFH